MSFACNIDRCIYYKSEYAPYVIYDRIQYGKRFTNEKDPTKTLFIHSCVMGDENCLFEKCTSNSECFSNNCLDGRCLVNNEQPRYICQVKRKLDNFTIGCALNINEKCQENKECISGYCNQYRRICFDNDAKYQAGFVTNYFFIIMGIVMLILLTFILYLYTVKDKLLNRVRENHESFLSASSTSAGGANNSPGTSISDTNEQYYTATTNNTTNNATNNNTDNSTTNNTTNNNTTNNTTSDNINNTTTNNTTTNNTTSNNTNN
ncbi:hypothetical protein PIROE2DRAFT_61969 [Piromyces sp. E2]|nr:hypothetical protein PIROE2DRAFT_61969 [Piromyces sp. E2]|eukprot:OUM62351.1 hypothetical protein PIROE2DRAFT_61969 [Piromyces sp. E2]